MRYNGSKPGKLAAWPKYNHYQADQRYQQVARMLGLQADTADQAVDSLAQAIYELGCRVGIEMNFKAQIKDKKTFDQSLDEIAYLAYGDQCTPVNPRLPLVKDMRDILEAAWLGYGENGGQIK